MPQAPTSNMSLVKPTELGDSGVWASLLDAMFDLIDAHDHSTGKGVKISMLNGVTVAADIPWNSGGTFYAITGLKAIDFQPRPQSEMTSFAGALFVDSANNELSYRTTGGAIIRFTNGSTFNFAAVGAIGGDYTAVGALVDFVDANDIYRFRQQLGGGVQQYARLDCGGVDLFEFKANPTAGVPANRVRLSSPAALAGSYEVTWPATLPVTKGLLAVDSAGVLTTTPTLPASTRLMQIDSAGSVTTAPATWPAGLPTSKGIVQVDSSGQVFVSGAVWPLTVASGVAVTGSESVSLAAGQAATWQLSTFITGVQFYLPIPVGSTITAWTMVVKKLSAAGTVTAKLWDATITSAGFASPVQIGATQSVSGTPGDTTLGQSGLSSTAVAGHVYFIAVVGGGTAGDAILGGSVTT